MSLDHMSSRSSQWRAVLALLLAIFTVGSAATAQDGAAPPYGPDGGGQLLPIQDSGTLAAPYGYSPAQPPEAVFQPPVSEDVGVGGMGVLGRFGHIAGPNIERQTSLTYLDLSPYIFVEDTYFFTDLRGFYTNEDEIGGSTGVGARHFFRQLNTVVGGSFWYDMDASRNGVQFDQVGFSGELFTEWLDVRFNYYQPQGQKRRDISTQFVPGSVRFQGNNIAFNTSTTVASALEGGDLTFTVPVVGQFAQQFNTELSAGVYHYEARNLDLERVWGWKLRLDGDLFEKVVHSFVEFTSDNVFDKNVVFGIDLNYWNGQESRPRLGTSQFNRISQWTRRNRNVVANTQDVLNPDQLATDPNGNIYNFVHIRNLPPPNDNPPANSQFPGGAGTIDDPYRYLQEAFANSPPLPGTIYYVHADSVYNGADPQTIVENPLINTPINLVAGQTVLGESNFVTNTLPLQGGGTINVPRATLGVNRPLFTNLNTGGGPIVNMANNSTFSGFSFLDSATTSVININGVGNVVARDNVMNGITGNGITVTNAFGTVSLDRTRVGDDPEFGPASAGAVLGNSLEINGGNALISLQEGELTHIGANGNYALRMVNNFGVVNLTGTEIVDIGGNGVLISGSNAQTTLESVFVSSTGANAGFKLLNSFGNVAVNDFIFIDDVGGPSVEIVNYDGNFTQLGDLIITNRNDIGVQIDGLTIDGSVAFNGLTQINIGQQGQSAGGGTALGDAAINFQNSGGAVRFAFIDINGSPLGAGINIGDRAGVATNSGNASFVVLGSTSIDEAGGVFAGTPSSSIQILNDGAAVDFGSTLVGGTNLITDRTDVGIEIRNTTGPIRFFGATNVDNTLAQVESALQIFDTVGPVSFTGFSATGVLGTAPTAATPPIAFPPIAGPGVDIRDNVSVGFSTLSVIGTGGTMVYMQDNQTVSTGGGAIEVTNGTGVAAVHVDNTTLLNGNLTFDRIRAIAATGGTNAILVQNLAGGFTVNGIGTVAQNTIQGFTVAGAQFDNVGRIVLQNQVYTGNPGGAIDVNTISGTGTTNILQVRNSQITNNGLGAFGDAGGLNAFSVFTTTLQGNNFNANLGANQIRIVGTTDDDYFVTISDNNTISDGGLRGGNDMVRIDGLTTNGILHLNIADNGDTTLRTGGFQSQRTPGQAALGIVWQGGIADDSVVLNNLFNMQGGTHTGFGIFQGNAALNSGIQYSGNVLQTGTNVVPPNAFNGSVGLDWTFNAQTTALITNNFGFDATGNPTVAGFQMGGIGSTAMLLQFDGAGSNVTIQGNRINFSNNATFGTAVAINQVVGNVNTTYNIGLNIINLFDNNTLDEVGFDFSGVQAGTVVLVNQGDNLIQTQNGGGFTGIVAPGGTTTGQISINGVLVP